MTYSDNKAYFFKIDTTIKKVRNFMQKSLSDGGVDLTVDQWVVLDHIMPNPNISQSELGSITFKDAPTITRILDILVKKNLIDRTMSTKDRRQFAINLTKDGIRLHKIAFEIIIDCRKKAWSNLETNDYDNLVRIMDTIYTNIDSSS